MLRKEGKARAESARERRARVQLERAAQGDLAAQRWVLARLRRLPVFLLRLNRRRGRPLSQHELADVL
jgi:hypothetical protein